MNVAHLKKLLSNLSETLSESGARTVAKDLGRISEALDPFADRTLAKFADFLLKAHEFEQTGAVSGGRKIAAKPVDPKMVEDALNLLNDLYERATSPEVTYQQLDAEVAKIDKQFKKDAIVEIATRFGVSGKTKKAAVEAIHRKIKDRKESFERTRF